MIINHLKLIWRHLVKDRQFTLLNLVGLSSGLACTFLIWLWVSDEWQMDRFHVNDSRLFQVLANQKNSDGIRTEPATSAMLARTLASTMPEVEDAIAVLPPDWYGKTTFSVGDNATNAVGIFADSDYFKVFSYRLLQGSANQVLTDKQSIVLSKDMAIRLFHTTRGVVGKTVDWQHTQTFVVSGIFDDISAHSSVHFDYVLPMDQFLETHAFEKNWGHSSDPATYVVLKSGADIGLFNRKIAGFMKTKYAASNETLFARAYSRGYLYGRYENGIEVGGRIEYVRLFSIIAIFILLIACINFMNLSTAKASRRMKEVGIKKVVGARRFTLVIQYLTESVLMTAVSMVIALVIVALLLPGFNAITGKQLLWHIDGSLAATILAIVLITGLIAGSYPALYLSGFKPIAVLKSTVRTSFSGLWIRKGLVVLQFCLSFAFIVGVLIVYRQVQYIQTKDLGFNRDNILSFGTAGIQSQQAATLLAEIRALPGVVNAGGLDHSSVYDFGRSVPYVDGKPTKDFTNIDNLGISYGLIETLGLKMVAGRGFSRQLSSDSAEIIINQAAVDAFGIKNPIGRKMEVFGGDGRRTIVGVVKDFNFQSLHENVQPMALRLNTQYTDAVLVKIHAGQEQPTIARIEELYKTLNPGFPFEFHFLDDDFQAQYAAEKRIAVLSRYFGGLAILISCLGLFGLVAFTAERRFKEIGIRKVLGASSRSIMLLLTGDFLRLVLLAILLAFPLSWWAMDRWLQSFAYRISLSPLLFLAAAAAVLLLTLLTISFQSIKAAFSNPAARLRSE
ncbi:MAG TPA: ABC transporter permease [Puia sp.]|nr:ABC transporter permease [Puia sp.]